APQTQEMSRRDHWQTGGPLNSRRRELHLAHFPRTGFNSRSPKHFSRGKEVAMRTAIVIPARYGAKRLPAKPLLKSTGKYLIQHVKDRACRAKHAECVVIATDDSRIAAAVAQFGGNVVMTRRDHPSGTDRVAEVAATLDADVVVNLQGDEPEIEPAYLDLLPELLRRDPGAEVATLAVPISHREQWLDPNCVKVVCDRDGRALYFSRAPIPFVRDGQPDFSSHPPRFLQHLGLYAFRRKFLL